MGSRPWSPFGLEGQSPLNFSIPTNKKLEVWAKYRLLSLVATYPFRFFQEDFEAKVLRNQT